MLDLKLIRQNPDAVRAALTELAFGHLVSYCTFATMPRKIVVQSFVLAASLFSFLASDFSMADPTGEKNSPGKHFTDADFAEHIAHLQPKLAGKDFTVVIQPPFVVVGDGSANEVRAFADQTVKWAVDKLKQDYFQIDPPEILDIWLFKDKASYEKNAKRIFDDEPDTPYGYYSFTHKSLIMNIATGGGTLVHEIVHPFMRANFPECPPWFNEGLGSLYEQSGEKNGHIYGYTNWRLAGLQEAIRTGKTISFESLTALNEDEFYHHDKGTNYGQARYLCYYLQEKRLLVKFYREFSAHQKKDPTGFKSLKQVLGEEDMNAFQKQWEAFVLKLTFP